MDKEVSLASWLNVVRLRLPYISSGTNFTEQKMFCVALWHLRQILKAVLVISRHLAGLVHLMNGG